MPGVEFPPEVSGRVREAALTGNTAAEMPGVPARSMRRSTARRASARRATARKRRRDPEESIIEFLADHPGSTAGDLAKHLNLDPGVVAAHLAQLVTAGEIDRALHGYNCQPDTADADPQPDAAAIPPLVRLGP